MKHNNRKCAAAAVALSIAANSAAALPAFAENESSGVYVLMNIPYEQFYSANSADIGDVDAISSATNKTGNYGKAGGAYHSEITAEISEDGTVTAVGGANGSKVKGVTWAVKADSIEDIIALGGTRVTDESKVTVATVGRGSTSSTNLLGYQALTEAPAYSYYVLSEAPENYLVYENGSFVSGTDTPAAGSANVNVSYDTRYGDVQLDVSDAADVNEKIINAVVVTAEDGSSGLIHISQIWSYKDLAWKISDTANLNGKKIKNIRYYCSEKDADTTDTAVPTYANYVYDYSTDFDVKPVFTGEVSGSFEGDSVLKLSGLPEDAVNVKAKVYYTTGGRDAVYTYITPLTVDSGDNISPVFVDVTDGKINIVKDSVTNKAGTTLTYGELVDGTSYTIEFSCDNYALKKITVDYKASAEPDNRILVGKNTEKSLADAVLGADSGTVDIVLIEDTDPIKKLDFPKSGSSDITIEGNGNSVKMSFSGNADLKPKAEQSLTLSNVTVSSPKNITITAAKGQKGLTLDDVSLEGKKAAITASNSDLTVGDLDTSKVSGDVNIKGGKNRTAVIEGAAEVTKLSGFGTLNIESGGTLTVDKSISVNTLKLEGTLVIKKGASVTIKSLDGSGTIVLDTDADPAKPKKVKAIKIDSFTGEGTVTIEVTNENDYLGTVVFNLKDPDIVNRFSCDYKLEPKKKKITLTK